MHAHTHAPTHTDRHMCTHMHARTHAHTPMCSIWSSSVCAGLKMPTSASALQCSCVTTPPRCGAAGPTTSTYSSFKKGEAERGNTHPCIIAYVCVKIYLFTITIASVQNLNLVPKRYLTWNNRSLLSVNENLLMKASAGCQKTRFMSAGIYKWDSAWTFLATRDLTASVHTSRDFHKWNTI